MVLQFGSSTLRYGLSTDDTPRGTVPMLLALRRKRSTQQGVCFKPRLSDDFNSKSPFHSRKICFDRLYDNLKQSKRKKPVGPSSASALGFFQDVSVQDIEIFDQKNFRQNKVPHNFAGFLDTYELHRVYGEDVYRLHPKEEFDVIQPIRAGRFNCFGISFRVCSDLLEDLFNYVLVEKLRIPRSDFSSVSIALAIPDTLSRVEIVELFNIFLQKLRFSSLVVHHESVLAGFSVGVSSACVIDVGAQKTSVCCVRDGLIVPKSCQYMPFGGDGIDELLLWTCKALAEDDYHFEFQECDLMKPSHSLEMKKLKESTCDFVPVAEVFYFKRILTDE